MFKRLLFGNEEKLQFKTSATSGIARLYSQAHIPVEDAHYWQSYLQLFETANDVFNLLSVADVRRALIRHPENIATLVKFIIIHLDSLQNDPHFSPTPTSTHDGSLASVAGNAGTNLGRLSMQASSSAFNLVNDGARTALGSLMGGSSDKATSSSTPAASTQRDRTREALNCCRILTRILPIIMEGDHDATCNVQANGSLQQGASMETDNFENDLLWSSSQHIVDEQYLVFRPFEDSQADLHSRRHRDSDPQEDQFVIEEDEEDDEEEISERQLPSMLATSSSNNSISDRKRTSKPPLGERLVRIIINILFYSGFTIPWTDDNYSVASGSSVAEARIHYMIWEKGIGNSTEITGKTRSHESNRLEVLRALLVFLSKSVFITPSAQQSTENHALRYLTRSLEKAIVLPLLCSLLNVSVAHDKENSWLGSLTSLPVGIVNDKLGGGDDVRQTTISIALQILNITLAYEGLALSEEEGSQIASANGALTPSLQAYSIPGTPRFTRPLLNTALSNLSMSSGRTSTSKANQNLFRFYISKLHRQADFQMLADGILAILGQRPNAASLLSTAASAQVTDTSASGPHIPESILLLWRMLWHNGKFRTFMLDEHSPQLLSNLLFHALNNKDSAARQGLVRLTVFILHDISCDRAFAVNICKAGSGAKARITGGQRWGVAVGGGSGNNAVSTGNPASGQSSQASTGADILIQAVYALIATTKSTLSALYAPMVITLTNVSPYFKNLSIFSANRLLSLFSSFSNASFLLADEGNPRVLYYLIETLNSIVQHGFQRNANVIYAIVRNHHTIERLANFTLRRGIAEVRRSRKRSGVLGSIVSSPRTENPPSSPRASSATVLSTTDVADPSEQEKEVLPSSFDAQPGRDEGATTPRVAHSAPASDEAAPASEKARGKMRRSSTSDNVQHEEGGLRNTLTVQEDEEDDLVNGFNDEELYMAASMIGREGFVPTQQWVTSWHKGLPLDVLQIAVVELVPKVQDLCTRIGSQLDADERVLAWLREQNLESVLPPVPSADSGTPLQPRSFKWTPQVSIWLLSYVWGLVYVTSTLPYGLFNGSNARLFQLRLQESGVPSAQNSRPSTNGASDIQGGTIMSDEATRATSSAARQIVSPRLGTAPASLAGMGSSMLGGISSALGLGIQPQSPQLSQTSSTDRDAAV